MFDRASLKLGLDKAVLQSMSGRENSLGAGGGPGGGAGGGGGGVSEPVSQCSTTVVLKWGVTRTPGGTLEY